MSQGDNYKESMNDILYYLKITTESYKQDHDKIIKITSDIDSLKEKNKELHKTQTDFNNTLNDINNNVLVLTNNINDVTGNVNQLADKIVELNKSNMIRRKYIFDIASKIFIGICTAIIIYILSCAMSYIKIEKKEIQRMINNEKNIKLNCIRGTHEKNNFNGHEPKSSK